MARGDDNMHASDHAIQLRQGDHESLQMHPTQQNTTPRSRQIDDSFTDDLDQHSTQ